ncbi:threonine/serine exporter, partial [Limosilactobacillus fermentum]|nr:threonine/serine exporter [Limosilactobacillus fermentum]MCT3442737.1 threonine/serine exporter [Limosilactobacillus fermentum]
LVPGVPITNAARDIVSGNVISGIARALEAVLTAASIGCAIVLVLRYL